jgi:hypothetical protein
MLSLFYHFLLNFLNFSSLVFAPTKQKFSQRLVAHACNANYIEGRD